MKNLEPEQWICITLGTCFLAIVIAVTTYNIVIDHAAIKAGLHQGTLVGSQGVHWVK